MTDEFLSGRRLLATMGVAGSLTGCIGGGDDGSASPGSRTTPDSGGSAGSGTPTVEGSIYVGPDGAEDNPGTEAAPLGRIQDALSEAEPGGTIHLLPGEYREDVQTIRPGEPDAPTTITGPPAAVWRGGSPAASCFEIHHSHVHVTGITIDGLVDESRAYESRDAYASTLVSMSPTATHTVAEWEPVDYLRDVVLEPSRMGNWATNMVFVNRLRGSSIGGFEVIGPAGMMYHPNVEDPVEAHVGEIVYIGTGPDDI